MMVGHRLSSHPPVLPVKKVNGDDFRKTAEIVKLPKTKLPPLSDYARACASVIWATFPAPSLNGVCARAEAETRAACADTFARILTGQTKKPDGYLMRCVLGIASTRGVTIPEALIVRPVGAA